MPKMPSLSRQARLARSTIRVVLWVTLIAYGISAIPHEARARIAEQFLQFIQDAIQSASKGKPP